MANWHINPKGEVHPCRAKPGNCNFGGSSGEENHFSSKESAELSQAKKNPEYSTLGTRRKKSTINIGRAKPETQAAVEILLDKGLVVTAASNLDSIVHHGEASEVDILDEELRGLSLELVKGGGRPF